MNSVKVSPKYQVVIPKAVRARTGILPGERLQVLTFDGRIELLQTRRMREMRGFLRGLDPTFVRDEEDRA
jgi:AbrB family looped-hinge helix DNA binding protein